MTLVEVMTAMLVTLIIGGSTTLFLKSGLDMEQVNTASAVNQQSLRVPFLELSPLVERAGGLEILTALPTTDSLKAGEMVAYIADPRDSNNLTATQNNMYLRTKSGDRMIPGFSQIAEVRFERASLRPSGASLSSEDQAVRLTLTAKNSERELVYSADVRSLNRVPVEGPASGRFLKIDTRDLSVLYPFIKMNRGTGGTISMDNIPDALKTALPVGTKVAGYFEVLSGNPNQQIEYEWRLYVDSSHIGQNTGYNVIGKPGGAFDTPALKHHYEYRFTSIDVALNPPTGTTAHREPPDLLELEDSMVNKYLVVAGRKRNTELWYLSDWYLITKKPAQGSSFWKDLIAELKKDQANKTHESLFNGIQNAVTGYTSNGDDTYLNLSGSGVDGRPFLSKQLDEKYFGKTPDGKRDPEFCLENYTIWVDAIVGDGSFTTHGWTSLLNSNVIKGQVKPGPGNKRPGDQAYGYGFQFDPGMHKVRGGGKAMIEGAPEYFIQKSLGTPIENGQGFIIRRFVGSTNDSSEGLKEVRRWKAPSDWKKFYPYYLWPDIAYKRGPSDPELLNGDSLGGPYANGFAISDNRVSSMLGIRYTTELNVITQTRKVSDNPLVTEPVRMFCRARVYDKPKEYDEDKQQWLFPERTGRSKEAWFGLEGTKTTYWDVLKNEPISGTINDALFGRGDVLYLLQDMDNKEIPNKDNPSYKGYAIGKTWGLRIWGGGAMKATIYFVDIAKGLPLEFELPWGKKVKDIVKSVADGGEWNPDAPYELKKE